MIDLDTPQDAYTVASLTDGTQWQLIFSDEFNTDGRTFYPGDDPYWEAVDLHYWASRLVGKIRMPLFDTHDRLQITSSGMILPQLRQQMDLWLSHSKKRKRTISIIKEVRYCLVIRSLSLTKIYGATRHDVNMVCDN